MCLKFNKKNAEAGAVGHMGQCIISRGTAGKLPQGGGQVVKLSALHPKTRYQSYTLVPFSLTCCNLTAR